MFGLGMADVFLGEVTWPLVGHGDDANMNQNKNPRSTTSGLCLGVIPIAHFSASLAFSEASADRFVD